MLEIKAPRGGKILPKVKAGQKADAATPLLEAVLVDILACCIIYRMFKEARGYVPLF
jgi:hypothetical protein